MHTPYTYAGLIRAAGAQRRYDGVIHLVTAADGAESFYKWGRTTDVRTEQPK
jgi:hypothetical protein